MHLAGEVGCDYGATGTEYLGIVARTPGSFCPRVLKGVQGGSVFFPLPWEGSLLGTSK